MGRNRGLTLIELAIVLVVLGVLLGMGAGIIGVLIKRVKYNESKEIVNAAVEGIIGYAITSGKLPDDPSWKSVVRATKDSYGKNLYYIYDGDLTSSGSICSESETAITVKVCPDTTCASPTQTINNVAFLIISGDGNYNVQTNAPSTCNSSSSCEIKVYEYGVTVDDNTADMNRPEPYDDIVKWVSLYELKPKVGCTGSGGGGGGGGGGSCTSYSLSIQNNASNSISYKLNSGSCNNISSGGSSLLAGLSSTDRIRVWRSMWCWVSLLVDGTMQSLDTDNNCAVNIVCTGSGSSISCTSN